jgi:ABC-2 type transport system permease protein
LFAGCVVYKKRQSESAGSVLAFNQSIPVVKYILMFCSTVLFGSLLFAFSSPKDVSLLILGYIIGAALSYMIVQSLIYKDVRAIKKHYKGMIIYIVIFLVFVMTLCFDIYGYQKRVPQVSEVKTVYFINPLGNYNYQNSDESPIRL